VAGLKEAAAIDDEAGGASASASEAPPPRFLVPHAAASVAHCVKQLTAIGAELHECSNLHKVLTDVLTRGDSCELISLHIYLEEGYKARATQLPQQSETYMKQAVQKMAAVLPSLCSQAAYQAWQAATLAKDRPSQPKLALFKRMCCADASS
jgi:hypothetical protein